MHRSNILAALLVLFAVVYALARFGWATQETASPGSGADSTYKVLAAPMKASDGMPPVVYTRTLQLLSTNAPGRDMLALARRLRLKTAAPIAAVVNAPKAVYEEGSKQQFYIADAGKRSYFTATATLDVVTPHAYWYIQDGYDADIDLLRRSAEYFEQNVYPTDRRVFGPEASRGVDNNRRITVLVAAVPGVGGYFSGADAYPRAVNPYSNERDMIYLANPPRPDPGDPGNYFEATLAHEFQHMIHWNVQPNREVWFDEGSSEIAMYLNGYDPGGVDLAFAAAPDTQLNAWDDPSRTAPHYGASYLFLRYLMDKFGGESLMSSLMQSRDMDALGMDSVLKSSGAAGFDGAFEDWVVANVLNDRQLAGGRYSYSAGGRVQTGRPVKSYPATHHDTVHQYAADYVRLAGNLGSAVISFKGNSVQRVIAAGPHSGSFFWYSNRRDSGDATLTRRFDLRGTSRATLSFWTWYDIEAGFDYVYAEASTDGGATWDTLKGRYTTSDNPNGMSYGNAWTGISGAPASSTSRTTKPQWVQESMSLDAYAGKQVLLRFEYVTDEGYNRPGFAVDDLRIPEIGYSDDAETDSAWAAAGFIRIGTYIPQKWFVALVEKGSPNRVRQMTVGPDGTGSIDLSGLGGASDIREAILVIAPLATKTTELASYTVTIEPK
jgi:hypothetical protein